VLTIVAGLKVDVSGPKTGFAEFKTEVAPEGV